MRPTPLSVDGTKSFAELESRFWRSSLQLRGPNLGWNELPAPFSSTAAERVPSSSRAHALEEPVCSVSLPIRSVPEMLFHRLPLYECPERKIKEKTLERGIGSCYTAVLPVKTRQAPRDALPV